MTRHFTLLVDDRHDALLRVVGLCLRRGVVVAALRYGHSGRAGLARLDVEVSVDERHGRALVERLRALIEVRGLIELDAGLAEELRGEDHALRE
jgi:acetolactate synthase small subunit